MPLPQPTPGLVVHFDYLWRYEHEQGEESGSKRRPCVLVVAVINKDGQTEVVVAPITHKEPLPGQGVEIPLRVKSSLGLDDLRSWVIVDDLNTFTWPGENLYPIPGSPPGTYDYGFVPPLLLERIRTGIEAADSMKVATKRVG